MRYLLDTNVISEVRKPDCNPRVRAFTEGIPLDDCFLCSLSIGELCYGMERLSPGKKKTELSLWIFGDVLVQFKDRIINMDAECMQIWGRLCACAGKTLPVKDSLLAAAALTHHLIIITRNIQDFEGIEGIKLINPWE
jgi:predicted nucleic acid-binding protein